VFKISGSIDVKDRKSRFIPLFLQKGVFKNYGMSSSTPEMSLLKIMV
jgi:hypothetical protein